MDLLPLPETSQDKDSLCTTCEAINWDEIIRLTHNAGRGRVRVRQFLPDETKDTTCMSKCQICRAVATILPPWGLVNSVLASTLWHIGDSKPHVVLYVTDRWLVELGVFWGNEFLNRNFLVLLEAEFGISTSSIGKVQSPGDGPIRFLGELANFDYIHIAEKTCRSTHSACRGLKSIIPGLRLRFIDCDTKRVVEAEDHSEYVALSYVWGNTTTAVDPMSPGKQKAVFPAVVRDSIEVTLALGYRYLWVDRHCIDQDSAYKEHIIHRMDQVYKQARIVIIAATGDSADNGLPGVGVRRKPVLDFTVGSFTFRHMPPTDLKFVRSTKWATRGWTYQEGYLSSHRLLFSNNQTFFVCDEMIFPESVARGIELQHLEIRAPPYFMGGPNHGNYYDHRHIRANIEEYTSRVLTHDFDSLRAILGVLNDYRDSSNHQYHHLWGVPIFQKETSHEPCIALDWRNGTNKPTRRRSGFPSWSWTGWAGRARLPEVFRATLSMVYLDRELKTPLEAVYHNLSNNNAPPRFLYLRSEVIEVTFIPRERLRSADEHLSREIQQLELFAILPITDTEHLVCATYMDETVETTTSYPAILLSEYEDRAYSEVKKQMVPAQRATLLVVKETDGHFKRVGLVEAGRLLPLRVYVSVAVSGFSSTDLSKITFELAQIKSPMALRQQKWLRDSQEKTICLG